MTTIDGTLGSLRLRLDASHHAMLRDIRAHGSDSSLSAALHRVVAERHAALFSAPSVDAGASQPERPEGGPGQGERTPPAPTNVLEAVSERFLGGVVCSTTWDHPGRWWVGKEGVACCDDHIPEGWVRPDEAPAPTIYRHPLAHVHHGTGRCVFGEECSR